MERGKGKDGKTQQQQQQKKKWSLAQINRQAFCGQKREKKKGKRKGAGVDRFGWIKKMNDGLINCWIATDQKKEIGLSIFVNDEADLCRGDWLRKCAAIEEALIRDALHCRLSSLSSEVNPYIMTTILKGLLYNSSTPCAIRLG